MGSERGERRGGQTDTVFMAERNVSENAKRGAIYGRTDGGRTEEGRRQTAAAAAGGGILPSILPRPRSLARSSHSPQARSTCEVEAKQEGKEGRKERRNPSCRPAASALWPAAAEKEEEEEEKEEEEDKWTCPRRCVKPRLEVRLRAPSRSRGGRRRRPTDRGAASERSPRVPIE